MAVAVNSMLQIFELDLHQAANILDEILDALELFPLSLRIQHVILTFGVVVGPGTSCFLTIIQLVISAFVTWSCHFIWRMVWSVLVFSFQTYRCYIFSTTSNLNGTV